MPLATAANSSTLTAPPPPPHLTDTAKASAKEVHHTQGHVKGEDDVKEEIRVEHHIAADHAQSASHHVTTSSAGPVSIAEIRAAAQRSRATQPSATYSAAEGSTSRQGQAVAAAAKGKGRPLPHARLSMMDFLAASTEAAAAAYKEPSPTRPKSMYSPLIPNDPSQPQVFLPEHLFRRADRPTSTSLRAKGKARAATRDAVEGDGGSSESATAGLTAFEFLRTQTPPPHSPVRLAPTQRVHISVIPTVSTITMFGTTQTSANYSLSGRIVVEVFPRAAKQTTAALRRRSVSPLPSGGSRTSTVRAQHSQPSTPSVEEEAPVHRTPAPPPSIHFTSLRVKFEGYAYYCDAAGRFAGVKLAHVVKELLPHGYALPLAPHTLDATPQRFEIEFDLGVPGWLPASMRSRFGANFYTVDAQSVFCEDVAGVGDGSAVHTSAPPDPDGSESARPATTESSATHADAAPEPPSVRPLPSLLPRTSSRTRISLPSPVDSVGDSPRTSSWLGRSIKRSTDSSRAHSPAPDRGTARSAATVVVVKRCREVVPVPVARLAQGALREEPTVGATQAEAPAPAASTDASPPAADGHESPLPSEPYARTPTFALPPAPMLPPNPSVPLPHDLSKFAAGQRAHEGRSESPAGAMRGSGARGSTPMRHFLHRPVLHPPTDAGAGVGDEGLPFSLTLSLPSHVQIHGPEPESLSFGVQIEVGRTPVWNSIRNLGGLRLRDMELACLQTERHSSVPSRSFGLTFAIPPNPEFPAEDLPVLPDVPLPSSSRMPGWQEARLRQGYDRAAIDEHLDRVHAGELSEPEERNVERSRTSVVGPPPTLIPESLAQPAGATPKDKKGKGKSHTPSASVVSTDTSGSGSTIVGPPPSRPQLTSRPSNEGLGVVTSSVTTAPATKQVSRGRRVYNSAINRLSNFATAMMDAGLDEGEGDEGGSGSVGASRAPAHPTTEAQEPPRATYSFTGDDEHGVDLTRGRIRMTITLPLVTSSHSTARQLGTPQLLADSESPFFRIRHKLRVKLGFGLGPQPLGGEGQWGQSLVMCVPVRFTEAPPELVQRHFAPHTIGGVPAPAASHRRPSLSLSRRTDDTDTDTDVPILPAYTQLFREDGSRLADEGEDLPQYPGRHGAPPAVLASMRQRGSVTGPDFTSLLGASADAERRAAEGGEREAQLRSTPSMNRIVPSRVVDEEEEEQGARDSPGDTARGRTVSSAQRREIEEMLSETDDEERREGRHHALSTEDEDEAQPGYEALVDDLPAAPFATGDEVVELAEGEVDAQSYGDTQDAMAQITPASLELVSPTSPTGDTTFHSADESDEPSIDTQHSV